MTGLTVRDFPAEGKGKLSLASRKVGCTCCASRRGPGVPAGLEGGCGVPADWLLLSCGFPENCVLSLSHLVDLN